jgi:selenocysteine lyase/cysteine desulfurase
MTDADAQRRFKRRGFLLAGAGSAVAAGAYLAARDADEAPRAQQPAGDGYVNLATFMLASHPPKVREAIERHRRGLDENAALYLREHEEELEFEARAAAAGHLGAEAGEVALTDSTTMGLALVYGGLELAPGDAVLTTEHDFYATHEALRLRAERDGVRVDRARLYDEPEAASADRIATAIERALGPRTRAVAVTWVHSSSGVKLPLRDVADVVAAANRGRDERDRILLCVDGVHALGVEAESPVELGADVFVAGTHKWLFGPRGTGIVWAAPHAWDRIAPTIPSFDPRAYLAWLEGERPRDVPPGPLATPGGFHSFEHRWALAQAYEHHAGLGGPGEVARTTYALAARMKDGLAGVAGLRVKTPDGAALSSGLVCAEAGAPAGEIVDRLREEHRVVASVTPYARSYVRFGPSVANSEDDVDRALEAVAAVVS